MSNNNDHKIVWITGASSGIGLSLAKKFAENNFIVIASSRTQGDLSTKDTNIEYMQVDVTDKGSVYSCIRLIEEKYGKIDIAVFNAGICEYFDPLNFDVDIIEKNFSVNFFGVVNCMQASLRLLLKSQSPQIVGLCSSAIYLPFPRAEGYGASKSAALYFLQSVQAHLYKKVDISIVLPGFVKTPLTAKNDFHMPFCVSSEYAANYIYKKVLRRKSIIEFPLRLILLLKFIRLLPYQAKLVILSKLRQ